MLEIMSLSLDGWFSHGKVTLDFDRNRGITLIKGPTGSGKSAIVEALVRLLTGRTLRKKSSVKDFQNKVLDNGYFNSLDFRVGDSTYRVEEGRGRGELDGLRFLQISPEEKVLTESSPNLTWNKISETIGMNYDELTNLFVLGQRHSQILVDGTSGERSALLVSLFGFTRYDSSLKKVSEEIKRVTEEVKKLTVAISTLDNSLLEAEEDSQVLSIERQSTDEQQAELAEMREKKDKYTKKLSDLQDEKEKVSSVVHTMKYAISQAAEFEEAKNEELELKAKLEKLQESLDSSKEDVKAEITEIREKIERLSTKRAKLEATLASLKRDLSKVLELGNVCPINNKECPVGVPGEFKQEREDTLAQEIVECSDKLETYTKHEKKNKKVLGSLEKEKEKVDKVSRVERDLAQVQKTLARKPEVDKDGLSEFEGKLKTLSEKIAKVKEKISVVDEAISKKREEIAEIETNNKVLQDYFKFLKDTKASLESKKEEHSELSLELRYLAATLSVYKRVKMYKIDSVLDLLEEKTNERLDKISAGLYSVEFVSQKENSKGDSMMDSLEIYLEDPHKKVPISMSSGGESDYVSLALLLSLYEIVSEMSDKTVNLLFLDEVFGPLDRDSVERAFEEIVELTNALGVRVKLISHRDLNESLVTETWETTKENGITKVEIS